MAGLGSFADRQLLAENLPQLPVRYQVRASAAGMSDNGWKSEWRLLPLPEGSVGRRLRIEKTDFNPSN